MSYLRTTKRIKQIEYGLKCVCVLCVSECVRVCLLCMCVCVCGSSSPLAAFAARMNFNENLFSYEQIRSYSYDAAKAKPKQRRSQQQQEEKKKKKQHKLGQMLHIYELFMHIKKFSKRSNQKLEITVAGPVPVSPIFIYLSLSASVPSPFAFVLYLLLCLPALNPHKKNILVLLFNKKKIPVQVEAFSRDSFYSYVHLVRCSPLHSPAFPCILLVQHLVRRCIY